MPTARRIGVALCCGGHRPSLIAFPGGVERPLGAGVGRSVPSDGRDGGWADQARDWPVLVLVPRLIQSVRPHDNVPPA